MIGAMREQLVAPSESSRLAGAARLGRRRAASVAHGGDGIGRGWPVSSSETYTAQPTATSRGSVSVGDTDFDMFPWMVGSILSLVGLLGQLPPPS